MCVVTPSGYNLREIVDTFCNDRVDPSGTNCGELNSSVPIHSSLGIARLTGVKC